MIKRFAVWAGPAASIVIVWAAAVAWTPAQADDAGQAGEGKVQFAHGIKALKLDLYDRAVAHLTAAIRSASLGPRQLSDAHYFRGRALTRTNKRDLALADFNQSILFWPENTKALRVRCRALAIERNWEDAIKDCDQAVDLAPEDWRGWFTRGLLNKEWGRTQEAKSDLSAALVHMPDGMTTFPFVYRPLKDLGLIASGPPPVDDEEERDGD